MKQLLIFSFIIISSQMIAQEVRNLPAFNAIDVSGGVDVTLVESNETKAEVKIVKGDQDAILVTEVQNGELEIKFENKKKWSWNNGGNKADVTVYYKSLNSIDVSAGAKVYGDQEISAEKFSVDASSGARVKVNLSVDKLEVDISSGSSVTLYGSANEQSIDASSGSSYRATDLATQVTDVDVSSGATAKIWVSDKLEAEARSGGTVSYKGEPKNMDIESGKYSGGSVRKI